MATGRVGGSPLAYHIINQKGSSSQSPSRTEFRGISSEPFSLGRFPSTGELSRETAGVLEPRLMGGARHGGHPYVVPLLITAYWCQGWLSGYKKLK